MPDKSQGAGRERMDTVASYGVVSIATDRQYSAKPKELMESVAGMLCGVVARIFHVIIYLPMGLATTVLGGLYLGECKVQLMLPVYLLTTGSIMLIRAMAALIGLVLIKTLRKESQEDNISNGLKFDLVLFIMLVILLFPGSYWVYGMDEPDYNKYVNGTSEANPDYCHETCYKYTFALVTLEWVVLGLLTLITLSLCCCAIRGVRRDEPEDPESSGEL